MSPEPAVTGRVWRTSRHDIDLAHPRVMGIVNVTPDSFSDGGLYVGPAAAIAHCERLVGQGANILDIGGESTRPGAAPLPAEAELARVLPVLRAALSLGVPISVDTHKPEVMRAALDAGVDIVNDIHALQAPGALALLASHPRCGVSLMHMRGDPATMQESIAYVDVVREVLDFLGERARAAQAAGICAERIVLDPGIGFAKLPEHNLALLERQEELLQAGLPLLVGWSRKSTLGALTGRAVDDRLAASLAAALAAVQRGASIVRVHDVAATVDALRVWRAAGLGPPGATAQNPTPTQRIWPGP
jgi:dihydropteroate synthase